MKLEILIRELLTKKKQEILYEEQKKKVIRKLSEEAYKEVKALLNQYKFFQKVNSKFTSADQRLKIIDARVQKDLVSDTEALRRAVEEELEKRFKKKKLVYYKTDFMQAQKLYFPYMYRQGEHKTNDLFYKIDIKSCFYSIYSMWGLDTICKAEIDHKKKIIDIKYVARGIYRQDTSEIIYLLRDEKILRNALYGLTRSAWSLKIFQSGKVERSYFRGKLQNLDLTVMICSLLHYFVSQINPYLVYWNIDGGIIHSDGLQKALKFAEKLKITLRIEEQARECVILGLGSYKIGELETLHFRHGLCAKENEKTNIYIVNNFQEVQKWLKRML